MFTNRVLLTITGVFLTVCLSAQTRIGLHFTREELDIWRTRTRNAPYVTKNDAQLNSPDDWSRISRNADAFLANPDEDHWTGGVPASYGCIDNSSSLPTPAMLHQNLRDAGFYYLITGDTRYADAVRQELLDQANEPLMDFTNTNRWCPGASGDIGPGFVMAEWLTRLLYGYDYIKNTLSKEDKNTLNAWFLNAARYLQSNYDPGLNQAFVDRIAGNYEIPNNWRLDKEKDASDGVLMYYGGPKARFISRHYNNRRAAMASFVGLAGIFLNDDELAMSGKRFFKELLMFGVYPTGYYVDLLRGITDKSPEKGFGYSTLAGMFVLADALARTGDTELYDWTTKAGTTSITSGEDATSDGETAKGLRMHIQSMLELRNHVRAIYATNKPSLSKNGAYRVDGIDESKDNYSVWDIMYAVPNLYYQNAYIRSSYLRTAPGSVPYPAKAQNAGALSAWTLGQYPGLLLMFGQMEGKVWPYPTQQPNTPGWLVNQEPTITMLTPANRSDYVVGADIYINVDVADEDGSIKKVEFYNGDDKLGEDLTSPFDFTWKNVPGGEQVVSAKVIDDVGGSATTTARVSLTTNCSSSGRILMETWDGIVGGLVQHIPLGSSPTSRQQLTSFEIPYAPQSYYGNRVSGYICPPITGEYTFWITSDEQGELWLSPNSDPAKKQRIAYSNRTTTSNEWERFPSQRSEAIRLVAGQSYYIEAVRKVNKSRPSNNLNVGWQLPDGIYERPIPGKRLSEFPSVADNIRPTATITSLEYGDQFVANGDIKIDADASDSDGKVLRVEFFSDSVKLGEDLTSPYSFTWKNVPAGNYYVRARAVDNTGAVTLSSARPVHVGESDCAGTGGISLQSWSRVPGELVSDIPLDTPPTSRKVLSDFEGPVNIGYNYGSRYQGYICPPLTGDYVFWIAGDDEAQLWLSTDNLPENKKMIASVKDWTFYHEWSKYPTQQSAKIRLVAGKKYYVEALHKEAYGYDHLSVGWQLPDSYNTLERPIPGIRLVPFAPAQADDNARMAVGEEEVSEEATVGESAELSAYPNPFSDELFVKVKVKEAGKVQLALYDLKGTFIQSLHEGLSDSDEVKEVKLESARLDGGLYLIRLVTSRAVLYKKVLLIKR